jgi:hypothetical protein
LPGNEGLRELSVSVSGDGQFVAFESRAALVREDSNDAVDIHLLTRHTSEVALVSRGTDGLRHGDAADFNQGMLANTITIDVMLGDLADSLRALENYGQWLSGRLLTADR